MIALPLSSVRESLRTSGSLKVASPAPEIWVDDIDRYQNPAYTGDVGS